MNSYNPGRLFNHTNTPNYVSDDQSKGGQVYIRVTGTPWTPQDKSPSRNYRK